MGFIDSVSKTVRNISDGIDGIRDDISEFTNKNLVNPLADTIRNHRYASVVVVNGTGSPIRNVHVKHRYSSNFRSCHTWPAVEAGATSEAFDVEHATGALTTGKDWWFVCWTDADGNLVHNTGGAALDALNKAEELVETAGKIFAAPATAAASLAGLVGVDVEGYNNHTLSSKAAERPVRIVLRKDSILFDSRATDDEVFEVRTIPAGVWRGWDSRFEKVWKLELIALHTKLYAADY